MTKMNITESQENNLIIFYLIGSGINYIKHNTNISPNLSPHKVNRISFIYNRMWGWFNFTNNK